jgi:hypothetical protein
MEKNIESNACPKFLLLGRKYTSLVFGMVGRKFSSYWFVGSTLLSVFLFMPNIASAITNADFSWLPNDEANLAGYKIYYGAVSGQYGQSVDVGSPGVINGTIQATISGLTEGVTYYFVATAYDADGFESDYSQEVIWTAPVVPPEEELPVDNPPSTVTGVAVE